MINTRFQRRSARVFKDFMFLASTDMFCDGRHLFDCDYFTPELQAALRRWNEKEGFLIRRIHGERLQQTFAEFLVEGAGVGKPLELLVQWLARGSEDDGQKCDNTNQWRSPLIRFFATR